MALRKVSGQPVHCGDSHNALPTGSTIIQQSSTCFWTKHGQLDTSQENLSKQECQLTSHKCYTVASKKRTFAAVHGNIKSRRRPVLAAVHLSFIAMTYIANTQNGSSATISLCTDDKYVTFHSGSVKQAINKLNSVIKKLETGRPMTNISKCSITLFS